MAWTSRAHPPASEAFEPLRTMTNSSLQIPLVPPTRNQKGLRTYSKRASKPTLEPSQPIQEPSSKAINTQETSPSKSDVLPHPNPKKRSISDFFRPISSNPRSSSPALSHTQSSPIPSSPQTVPSSPPSLYSQDEKENELIVKKRVPRRLNSRQNPTNFTAIIMEDKKYQKVEKLGIDNFEEEDLGDIREQARAASPEETPATTSITRGRPSNVTTNNRTNRTTRTYTTGAANATAHFTSNLTGNTGNTRRSTVGAAMGYPSVTQAAVGYGSAPAIQNTGGTPTNAAGPAIVIDEPSVPIDTRDHGASEEVYNLRSFRRNGPPPILTDTAGRLVAPAVAAGRHLREVDGDAASLRSIGSTGSIGDLVGGGHMSDVGDNPPNTAGAIQRGRRMTASEVSLQLPVSAARKSREKPNSMGFDGAYDDRPYVGYVEIDDIALTKRKRALSTDSKENADTIAPVSKRNKGQLIQSTLNLAAFGKEELEPKTCTGCGYLISDYSKDGLVAHDKYHQKHFAPVSVKTISFSGRRSPNKFATRIPVKGGQAIIGFDIVGINNGHAQKFKKLAEDAVKRLHLDIDGIELTKEQLWENIQDDRQLSSTARASERIAPHHVIYLAIKDNNIVSVVLAQRINTARVVRMIPCDAEGKTGEDGLGETMVKHKVEYTSKTVKAIMGVHYMWTHEKYRRRGILAALMDHARTHFISGKEVPRNELAFTNMTEAGRGFASRFLKGSRTSLVGKQWSYREYDYLSAEDESSL